MIEGKALFWLRAFDLFLVALLLPPDMPVTPLAVVLAFAGCWWATAPLAGPHD